MTRVIHFQTPEKFEFDPLLDWPDADQSVGSITVETQIMVLLPHRGTTWSPKDDPFTHFMREAYRVLVGGGTLEIKAPWPGGHTGMGHPCQQRIYTEATWYAFGCPEEKHTAKGVIEKGKYDNEITLQKMSPKDYKWGFWHGIDFGVRFQVMSCVHDEEQWTVFYRKFTEEELV